MAPHFPKLHPPFGFTTRTKRNPTDVVGLAREMLMKCDGTHAVSSQEEAVAAYICPVLSCVNRHEAPTSPPLGAPAGRGHSGDCSGCVLSRVESSIENQDSCKGRREEESDGYHLQTTLMAPIFNNLNSIHKEPHHHHSNNYPPQDLIIFPIFPSKKIEEHPIIEQEEQEEEKTILTPLNLLRVRIETKALMREAMEARAKADEKRKQAKRLIEMTNRDIAKATRIREEALFFIDSSSSGQEAFIACNFCKHNNL